MFAMIFHLNIYIFFNFLLFCASLSFSLSFVFWIFFRRNLRQKSETLLKDIEKQALIFTNAKNYLFCSLNKPHQQNYVVKSNISENKGLLYVHLKIEDACSLPHETLDYLLFFNSHQALAIKARTITKTPLPLIHKMIYLLNLGKTLLRLQEYLLMLLTGYITDFVPVFPKEIPAQVPNVYHLLLFNSLFY